MRAVIKIGSSVMIGDEGLDHERLQAICSGLGEVQQAGWQTLLVASGAVARGVGEAAALGVNLGQRSLRPDDVLRALSALGQGRLFAEISSYLDARNIASAEVLLTFGEISNVAQMDAVRRTLQRLLRWQVVPVINENDTITTDDLSFGDNDFLAAQVAVLVKAHKLLLLTETDGVFSANPSKVPNARPLSTIADVESAFHTYDISESTSSKGSGGMASKLRAAQMAATAGVEVVICSGLDAKSITDVLLDNMERGTRVQAAPTPRGDTRKFWVQYGKRSRGRIVIDEGAARALCLSKASLLPVGIVEIFGSFERGDAVDVEFPHGRQIAKGITQLSYSELHRFVVEGRRVRGARFGPAVPKEAIDRSDLVVLAGVDLDGEQR